MQPRRFEEIEVGDELPEYVPDVTLDTVRNFANAAIKKRSTVNHSYGHSQGNSCTGYDIIIYFRILNGSINRISAGYINCTSKELYRAAAKIIAFDFSFYQSPER